MHITKHNVCCNIESNNRVGITKSTLQLVSLHVCDET